MDDDNNKLYGNHGEQSWDFKALDYDDDNADANPEMDIDNDSTAAEHDSDRDQDWDDVQEEFRIGGDDDYQDDHRFYSHAHDGALHLEDTTMTSDEVVDINLDEPNSKVD